MVKFFDWIKYHIKIITTYMFKIQVYVACQPPMLETKIHPMVEFLGDCQQTQLAK